MPDDIQNGTVQVSPHYVEALPTNPPVPTEEPTPTIDPSEPTAKPTVVPTYYFSVPEFSELSSFPAKTEIAGMTVSADSSIESSSKQFAVTTDNPDNSGYKYSKLEKHLYHLKFQVPVK